ncbi:hypothetical protein [Nocardiopsis sp. NPDC006938]|uniref:hypothetical protein n=1 Tax=Nocardiopsis sp. NPDC006938 TaxID=3364337 RepID=UPI0036A81C26
MSNAPFRVLTPPEAPAAGDAPCAPPAGDGAPATPWTVDAGHRPPVARVEELAAEGHSVLVRCTPPEGEEPRTDLPPAPPGIAGAVPVAAAEEVALASLYAWAGARVFVTAHPERVGRALDMVASVRGERPPAAARRGLA